MLGKLGVAIASCLALVDPAAADTCTIDHAIYRDRDGLATMTFRATGQNAIVTNTFGIVLSDGTVLDGLVLWTDDVERPNGRLSYKCPDGDVTGEEFEACTLWQGVVYSIDETGTVDLLPKEGGAAPKTLILSDLGSSMKLAPAWPQLGIAAPPFDVFALNGCAP